LTRLSLGCAALAALLGPTACATPSPGAGSGAVAPVAPTRPTAPLEPTFWKHWSDGNAEVSGYTLTQPRYGALRTGYAVAIYVTEPYSRSALVKADRYAPDDPDQTTALKLNLVRKFETGIYDYSLMTSVFAVPTEAFTPLEVTFSSQEWCGHVFDQVQRSATGLTLDVNSYFEGESERAQVDGADVLPEDALWLTLRGLGRLQLDTTDTDVRLLPSATYRRLQHKPAVPYAARVTWSAEDPAVQVPAGKFAARRATWPRADGVACSADLEVAYPHRVLQWQCADGEHAALTGSARLPYWQQNALGDERLRGQLGLPMPR
jgi:hypothetical protein